MTKAPRTSGASPTSASPATPAARSPGHGSLTAGLAPSAASSGPGSSADGPDPTAGLLQSFALPNPLREKFEDSLGVDLGGVRLHTDDASAAEADALGARAFATGSNIHFAAGQYRPDDPFGQHLIAHEVAHTVQQSSGTASGAQLAARTGASGESLEVEADRAADAMVAGKAASISARGATGVMRKTADGPPGETSKADPPKVTVNGGPEIPAAPDADWKACGGEKLISSVRAVLAAWRKFRGTPNKGEWNDVDGVRRACDSFQDRVQPEQWDSMRAHANRQLGSADLAALEEMLSVTKKGHSVTEVFNVKPRQVKHTYKLKLAGGDHFTSGTLSYENDLPSPWKWSHPITLVMGGFTASFELEIDPKDPLSSKGSKKIGADKVLLSGTLDPVTSPVYYGWDEFQGMVTGSEGPKGGGLLGPIGVEVATGMALRFSGTELTFANLRASAKPSVDMGKGKIRFTVSAIKEGIGAAVVSGDPEMDNAPLPTAPGMTDVKFEQKAYLNNFAIGSAEITPPMHDVFNELRSAITNFRSKRIEPHLPTLKKMGVSPESLFKLEVQLVGWASRRWSGAVDDAERRKRNEQLSLQRAQNALSPCQTALGDWNLLPTVQGRGARLTSEGMGNKVGEGEVFERLATVEKRLKALEGLIAGSDPVTKQNHLAEQKKLLDEKKSLENDLAKLPNKFDSPLDQSVDIIVRWSGKLPDEGMPSTVSGAPKTK